MKQQVYRTPDLTAPRYRRKIPTALNRSFYRLLRRQCPELSHLADADIRKIIVVASDVFREKVVELREGVQFPEQLGFMFIGSVPETKHGNVDYKKSQQYGKVIRHKNYDTDGLTAKIFYTNYGTTYHFKYRELWKFCANKEFRKQVSIGYLERYNWYVHAEQYNKISWVFKNRMRDMNS